MTRSGISELERPHPRFDTAAGRVLLAALLGGGLLRLWFHLQWLADPLRRYLIADENWYLQAADRIAGGHLIAERAFYFGPLYSYALAPLRGIGLNHDLLVTLQHLLGLASCYLVYRIGSRVFSEMAGAVAALLFAFSPAILYYESFLLMESLLAFLVTGAALLLVEWDEAHATPSRRRGEDAKRLLPAGIMLGLAATGRPSFLALALAASILLWRRSGIRAAVLLTAPAVLIVALPVLHNSLHEGRVTPVTTSGGFNLYLGNGPLATGATTDVPFLGKEYDDGGRLYAEGLLGRRLSPGESSDYWFDRAVESIRENPGATLRLWIRKAGFLWGNTELPQIEWLEGDRRRYGALRFAWARFALVGALAAVGLLWGWKRRRAAAPALFALLIPLSYLPFFVTARYRVSWIPFLCVFAGFGVLRLGQALRGGSTRDRLLTGAVFVLALLASLHEPLSLDRRHLESIYRLRHALRADAVGLTATAFEDAREAVEIDDRNYQAQLFLGSLFREQRDWVAAERSYRAALRVEPESPEGWYGLAVSLHRDGRSAEALDCIERALEMLPREARFVEYSGLVYDALGSAEEAEERLRRAVALDESRSSAQLNYGTFLARQGRPQEAVGPLRRALELDPTSTTSRRNLALALLQIGQREAARRVAEGLPRDDPARALFP